MKKGIIITLAILILLIEGFIIYKAQKSIQQTVTSVCKNINLEEVKTKAREIDNKLYSLNNKDVEGRSTEGGEQTDYISNSNNRMIVEQVFFGETGKSEILYYFSNNKIFYVKKVNTEYLVPLSEDSNGKVKNIEVKEFILNANQELCSWYRDGVFQEINQDTIDLLNYLVAGI
jgi:hypothetical protein